MTPDTSWLRERWRQLAPPALGILALMLFLVIGRPPSDSYGWRMLFEIGHVPLFGVTALLMLRIVRVLRSGEALGRADFLIALLATAILSLVTEATQLLQPGRHANVGDALQNLAGALCFIAIAASRRPGLWQGLGRDGPVAARLVLIGAVLALGLAVMPLAGVAWSYGKRAAAFPVLADLTEAWQRPFLNVGRSELARVPAPRGWSEKAGQRVARLTFLDAPWPGFTVREPYPDWSAFEALRFQVWSELETPVEIVLRVDDTHRGRPHRDRFNGSFIITPGLNDFTVPMATIAQGPRDRQLDVGDIRQFILFSRRPDEPFELYFSPFWLEGGDRGRIADVP
jgi:VanZ family protein